MGNKMSGHDDDDMKRVKGRYAGEMLFDDEDDYDDDADDDKSYITNIQLL